MKHLLVALLSLSIVAFTTNIRAADKGDAKAQLQELVGQVRAKLKEGKPTEQSLAGELKQFDALLAEHKGEKTDDIAQILLMKAMLYLQVLDDEARGKQLIGQLKTDFPDTKQGKNADNVLASIAKQAEARKIQRSLAEGAAFPDFEAKDLDGKPLSVAGCKGKVVLIDFWATWCGPCIREMPNVLAAYEKHHAKGLEIIGINLDQDKERLTKFIADKKMPWPQYFDGLGWQNKLAAKYGVNSIPATYLLDKEGRIIAKNLRGKALEAAIAKALGQ
jgi:thiol-disulfide isomerase/thioredoxin